MASGVVPDGSPRGRVLWRQSGTVTRPHTGSGATKALQDVLALGAIAVTAGNWDEVVDTYNRERVAIGVSLVEMGRRLGRAQVEETQNWAPMEPDDFQDWISASLAGETLYLYGSDGDPNPDLDA